MIGPGSNVRVYLACGVTDRAFAFTTNFWVRLELGSSRGAYVWNSEERSILLYYKTVLYCERM